MRSALLRRIILGIALFWFSKAMAENPVLFVQTICQAIKQNDDVFLKTHIQKPFHLLKSISEGAGNPTYQKKRLTSLAAIKDLLSLCDDLSWKRAKVNTKGRQTKVYVPIGQFSAEFTLKKAGDSFLLISFKG